MIKKLFNEYIDVLFDKTFINLVYADVSAGRFDFLDSGDLIDNFEKELDKLKIQYDFFEGRFYIILKSAGLKKQFDEFAKEKEEYIKTWKNEYESYQEWELIDLLYKYGLVKYGHC